MKNLAFAEIVLIITCRCVTTTQKIHNFWECS